jgi:hypothetical protein
MILQETEECVHSEMKVAERRGHMRSSHKQAEKNGKQTWKCGRSVTILVPLIYYCL